MVVQKNKLFREACLLTRKEAQKDVYMIDKWKGWAPVWSGEDLITKKGITLGTLKSIGIYVIKYIPTGKIMYVGQGVIWSRKIVHRKTFNKCLEAGGVKEVRQKFHSLSSHRNLSEAGIKMYAHDSKLKNWSFDCCVTDSKSLSKQMEKVWKDKFNPPFNVKGFDVT
tara:strand:- start:206 stop:706 length:501 start_codon:yes stop_codon:yes gene_type:complete